MSKKNLKDHLDKRHNKEGSNSQTCSICSKTVMSIECLVQHLENEHALRRDSFKRNNPKRNNAIVNQEAMQYQAVPHCPRCNLKFRNETERKNHVDKYHVVDTRKECFKCQQRFGDRHALMFHISKDHKNGQSHYKKQSNFGRSSQTEGNYRSKGQKDREHHYQQRVSYKIPITKRYALLQENY